VSIGIARLAYRLPTHKRSIDQLEKEGRINSPASLLSDFGFKNCYIQEKTAKSPDLLLESAKEVASGIERDSASRIFLYSGINSYFEKDNNKENALELFQYPVAKLRHALELPKANSLAISQQGCSGLLSAIDIAYHLLKSSHEENESILCATVDVLTTGTKREIMYNVMSDAAASVLITKNSDKNRIVYFHQQILPYYWDTPLHENELLASYFPMAQRAIESALWGAGLKISDIKWFVPHNVSLRSWEILAKLLHIPMERIWTNNIARVGHTVSSDHIINLVDMEQEDALKKGDYLLLFTFGFGASWSCLILQH